MVKKDIKKSKKTLAKTTKKTVAKKKTISKSSQQTLSKDQNLETLMKRNNKNVDVDNEYLPDSYLETKVTLVTRDPFWIYAYWDICPDEAHKLRLQIGYTLDHCAYVLRVYDISLIEFNGHNANHWFDVDLQPFEKSRYINLLSDNVSLCADLGVRTPDGQFITMKRSNYISTQRFYESGMTDFRLKEIMGDFYDCAIRKEEAYKQDHKTFSPDWMLEKGNSYSKMNISRSDIEKYYGQVGVVKNENHFFAQEPLNNSDVHQKNDDQLEPPKFHEQSFQEKKYNGKSFGVGAKKTVYNVSEVVEEFWGASEHSRRVIKGGSEEWQGGASEQLQTQSIPEKRGFFFEMGMHITVYGRTEADAKVLWNDKVVFLKKDGTFRMEMTLEDGEIPFDFKAISSNKIDKRRITTKVKRQKTQSSSKGNF